jgi:hypothetical protein
MKTKHKDESLASLVYLKFAMRGDLESSELLRQLLERHSSIEWDSPEFAFATEAMSSCDFVHQPAIPGTDAMLSKLELQSEVIAGCLEEIASLRAMLDNSKAFLNQANTALEQVVGQLPAVTVLCDYISALLSVHCSMRDKLDLLGADTSLFNIPSLPKSDN